MGTTDLATRVTLRTGGTHQDVLESAAVVDCRIIVAAGPSQVVVGVGLVQTKRLCTQNQAVSPLFAPGIHPPLTVHPSFSARRPHLAAGCQFQPAERRRCGSSSPRGSAGPLGSVENQQTL